ncbi:MAG: DNA-directed DNA polymerase alpha subunit pol12 [Geoglossum simile]|nr:MAG: DNA-directed DNA polymerase alpha subunit pol12 [Geoglossum simile]
MEDLPITEELHTLFAPPPSTKLPPDILGELHSILRLHSISPQELFYKWESYCLKMGSEETRLDLETARALKKDVQETLERETRSKAHVRSADKRVTVGSTPRGVSSSDVFNMLDGLVPNTPRPGAKSILGGSTGKRKTTFETPATSRNNRAQAASSPAEFKPPNTPRENSLSAGQPTPFADRPNAGQTIETLNPHLLVPDPPLVPPPEPRVKMIVNTDYKKFSYRPMAMHLSEASEVLDDRIDEFISLCQTHHSLEDTAFGNPASQSTSDVVAVGRIASDSLEGRLNTASLVLETSRRMGAGLRVPLKVDSLQSFQFFPGQIVALRGVNASGEYFSVKEILSLPLLPPAATPPESLDLFNKSLSGGPDAMDDEDQPRPLNILVAAGPYTADDNLSFEPLHALCSQASTTCTDTIILLGPFLDIEHPLVASGDFDLPNDPNINPDTATLATVFRVLIATPLASLAKDVPNINIILIPSVRDAISKHVSFPQDRALKKDLGLPKQATFLSNPVMTSLNEIMIGISTQDILQELLFGEVALGPKEKNPLARQPRHLIEQRHFFPLFPPTARELLIKRGDGSLTAGAMLDSSYLKLGEWLSVRPDVLITPSALAPFAKIVESVVVVNPGTLSKRKGAGTYAQLTVYPASVSEEDIKEGKPVGHKIYERSRVDIKRI